MHWLYFLSATLVLIFCGCGYEESEPETVNQMVYVDLQTRDVIVTDPTDVVPAEHPVTGERSLMPGMYCGECGQWHPAPPLEELQRNPRAQKCPECQAVLSADGPLPEAIQP